MSVYECPYCEAELSVLDLGTTDGFMGGEDSQEHTITCPKCQREIIVEVEIEADYSLRPAKTVSVDGEEVPDMEYDMADVMHHFTRRPDQLYVAPHEIACEVCRRSGDTDCRTAADYIKAGWRVVAEYPGVRATCPACRGGVHAHAA
ncbi:MAG: hypothetical protein AB7D37_06060 [Desulfovibrio sp.]